MSMRCARGTVLVLAGLLAGAGCKSEQEKQREEAAKQMAAAEKQMAESAKKLEEEGKKLGEQGAAAGAQAAAAGMQAAAAALQGLAAGMGAGAPSKAPLVDFRELKALLPESLAGLKRKSASGEKSAAMGMGVSEAKAEYGGEGKGRLRVKLIDTGGMAGFAAAAFAMAGVEIDKETEDGYEKTTKIDGRKAFEKYNNSSKNGEIKIFVGNRMLVEVDGDDLPMETLKEAVEKIDIGKLEALAPAAK